MKMTPRQRLAAILNKKPHDCLSWTALVDNNTLNFFPENLRGNFGIDFYRHIDSDIFLLNGWNTPYTLRSPESKWSEEVKIEVVTENGNNIKRIITPEGTLTGIYARGGHPLKYMIDSMEAVKIYTGMWENAKFVKHDDSETYKILDDLVGDDGIVTRFWGPSAIPRLLELDMGTLNFYYFLNDYPAEMKKLIETIHEKEKEAFRILAEGPWSCVILVENTSTHYISPKIYKQFNMPHQAEFISTIKNAGKTAILHMCGHVRKILHLIKETGCDGIHALTRPPTGDTPWEFALDVLGEDIIIIGALDVSTFLLSRIQDIPHMLDLSITDRLRNSNFILGVFADGIKVDLERFYAVSRWAEKYRY